MSAVCRVPEGIWKWTVLQEAGVSEELILSGGK